MTARIGEKIQSAIVKEEPVEDSPLLEVSGDEPEVQQSNLATEPKEETLSAEDSGWKTERSKETGSLCKPAGERLTEEEAEILLEGVMWLANEGQKVRIPLQPCYGAWSDKATKKCKEEQVANGTPALTTIIQGASPYGTFTDFSEDRPSFDFPKSK